MSTVHNKMCQKILDLYSLSWSNDPNHDDYYLHWLENDLTRWLNNDQALMNTVDDKLTNFMNRVPNLSLQNFLLNIISSHQSVVKILGTMTCEELTEFLLFVKNNILFTPSNA